MKALLVAIMMIISLLSIAQDKKTIVPQGQVFNLDTMSKAKVTVESLTKTATKTSNTAIYKGDNYPVYQSNRGKLFIVIVSRNGNYYKRYVN